MSDWLMRVIKAEAKHLIALAVEDDELRADLRVLAEEILAATQGPGAQTEREAPESDSSATVEMAEIGSEITSEETVEPLRELTLGRSAPARGESGGGSTSTLMSRTGAAHEEVAEIEARCRWKGEAARWAVERLLRGREGDDRPNSDAPVDPKITEWADKLTDCFYWAKASESSQQNDLSLLEQAAGCFESLAEGLSSVRTALERNQGAKIFERMLPLVAEAQSGLRVVLKRLCASDDPDQLEVFEWVKATAARHRVYLKRFMRADDAAEPAGWSDLLTRIEAATTSGQLSRQQTSELERIREHAKRIEAAEDTEKEWQAVIQIVDGLVADGVAPSNREIRDALLNVIDDLPDRDELPRGFRLVLREIDRNLSRRPAAAGHAISHTASAEVAEAALLLHSRSVVLIGGIRRREAQESLRRTLALSELIWIETKEHQSIDSFEPLIARADVAVVLLAIRWSSHAFGDVRHFCDRHNKLLVRLPGGYSPNQVALQIIAQCSGKLEKAGREPFSR
jgi:hypothetical protein